ncbi:MAG: acyl-CoA synthetase [Candidatus Methanolliviera hydrocarbonicum]|uniref:Acyl-CoA synthetase n=1 Tax=Candidatus Methanolliviera hydrocarbonicum TaxID=2491085 RepID=A0A520KWG9_9EURY|nr:MAG: acyl-CoA synthetase [Candidatus Methanolliviera hydrocarbonicum]
MGEDIFNELNRENIERLHERYNRLNRFVIADFVRRSAYRYPDKPAIIFRDKRYTYRELEDATNKFANALLDLGLGRFERVAVLAHNTHHQAISWFGILKAGGVMVPINYLLRGRDISYCINHSESTVFVVEDDLFNLVSDVLEEMPPVKRFLWSKIGGKTAKPEGWHDFDELVRRYPADRPDINLDIHDVVQFSYTSGTEALPKAVMLTNQSLIAEYTSAITTGGLDPEDIVINALPLYHCAQQHVFFTPMIWLGGTNILLYDANVKGIFENIQKYKATQLFCPPTVWIGILRDPDFDKYDLGSLKKGAYGAAKMPPEVLLELAKRIEGIRLWNHYGQTELSPSHTILQPEDQMRKPGSAGQGELNTETALLDDDDNIITKPGGVEEIGCRGPHIMLGYFKDQEKTENAFRGGWFHTGDLGVLDEDRYVEVVDRKKDTVKTGGENVSSLGVEEAIYKNKNVEEVAVIGLPHEKWIEAVTAIVVPREEAKGKLTEEEIIETCKKELAPFKVPKRVIIVDSLPKTPTGKLLKRTMREIYKDFYRG